MFNYSLSKLENKKELKNFISKVDNDFTPSLSSYLNIDNYVDKLIKNAMFSVAYSSNNIAGILAFYLNKETSVCFLTILAVSEDYRGKGVAKKLMSQLISFCKTNNYNTLILETIAEGKAKDLYIANDFYISDSFRSTHDNRLRYRMKLDLKSRETNRD